MKSSSWRTRTTSIWMISESDLLKAQKGRAKTKEIPTAFLQLNPTTQAILEVFEEFGDDLQLYSVCEPSATPLLSFFTTLAKNQQCFFSFSDEVNNYQNFIRKKKCFRNFKYLPTTVLSNSALLLQLWNPQQTPWPTFTNYNDGRLADVNNDTTRRTSIQLSR